MQTDPSKGQKNILEAWDFTKNKLYHGYLDNNLPNIFPKDNSQGYAHTCAEYYRKFFYFFHL